MECTKQSIIRVFTTKRTTEVQTITAEKKMCTASSEGSNRITEKDAVDGDLEIGGKDNIDELTEVAKT
eukprot:4109448-Heterocapsa_arctica.AAC.1